ncbi:hypothetical protein SLA2020_047470 [Shorea laevis]
MQKEKNKHMSIAGGISYVSTNNKLSHNKSLIRAVICSGLFPGIASVVHRETSMSFKTMDDGQVLPYVGSNSVNACYQTIPYPWLVFGEKVKVNTVFIRDSTGVSNSILMFFGGALSRGVQAGHLKMLQGYIDFSMDTSLAECYLSLRELENITCTDTILVHVRHFQKHCSKRGKYRDLFTPPKAKKFKRAKLFRFKNALMIPLLKLRSLFTYMVDALTLGS